MKLQNRFAQLLVLLILIGIAPTIQLQAQSADAPLESASAAKSKPSVIIHPFLMRAECDWISRSLAGAAIQVGRHELGLAYLLTHKMQFGGGVHYRYYLMPRQWRVQPYVGATVVRDKNLIVTYNDGSTSDDGRLGFAGLTFGAEFALAPGFSAFVQHSFGASRIILQDRNLYHNVLDGMMQVGLRGNFRVAGDAADRNWQRSSEFAKGHRLFVNLMVSGRPVFLDPTIKPSSSGTLNFGIEYRLTDFLRPYAGLSYGLIGKDLLPSFGSGDYKVGINGLQTGMRFYTLTRAKWAIFQDVGGSYSNDRQYHYHDSRFWVGQGISAKVFEGIFATGIMRYNLGERGSYADMAIGVSIAPFDWGR